MIRDLLKDMTKYIPAQVVPGIVGFISIPILTHLFSPVKYGNYALVLATISILTTIVGWVSMSIIRFYPAFERDKELDYFHANIIKLSFISIAACLIISFGILLVGKSYISIQLFRIMHIGLMVFAFTSFFNILQHFLRSKREINWYSGFTIWRSAVCLGLGLLMVIIFDFDIEGLLWGNVLGLVIIMPILWIKSVGRINIFHSKISGSLLKKMAGYSFPLVIGNLAAWILSLSDRYMLEFFRGSHEVGIYAASYNISEYSIIFISSLFMLASGPIGVSIWEKDGEEKSKEFIRELTRYHLIVCIPAVVGLSILARPIISVLTGEEYFEGYKIIPFVTIGAFFLGLQQRFQTGFLYYKRTYFITFSLVAAGLLNLMLNFLFIPEYGYIAAAVTTLISYAFLLLLVVVFSRRMFAWKFPFNSLAKATCASAIMGVIIYYIGNNLLFSVWGNLIFSICLGSLVYTGVLFLLKEFKPTEAQAILNLKARITG
jgi:O-antigen/teichoic acid export membrane protein